MKTHLSKKNILRKTLQIGNLTLLSRVFGLMREWLLIPYLGAGVVSDAFITAYKIPNSLRKIFAEGALSAAFIPTLVKVVRDGKHKANCLMSLAFVLFEGALLIICALVILNARMVVTMIAPGFSVEQIQFTVPFLRILMPFIFFISSSALLAGALQSIGHFFVPAFSPVLLNIVFIGSLLACTFFNLPVTYLCYFILLGGLAQFVLHLVTYLKLHFSFGPVSAEGWTHLKEVLKKFLPCLIGMSVLEISLFIDTSFASYLAPGSTTLLYYAHRFMGIPLGVLGTAFSVVLLSHFSRISLYAPRRLSFYLLESAKLLFWVMVPVSIVMGFFAEKIFHTLFLSPKFTLAHVLETGLILQAFLAGLFFFSLNKILFNLYCSLHNTTIPTVVGIIATAVNFGMNFFFIFYLKATGLALATTISQAIQSLLYTFFLYQLFGFKIYLSRFASFAIRCAVQMIVVITPLWFVYEYTVRLVEHFPAPFSYFLLYKIGFWLWAGPLALAVFAVLYVTRDLFGVRIYFLE